jgi:hypothetical protein
VSLSLALANTTLQPTGRSKEWKELSAVEQQSAEWLGFDEQRWKVH